MNIQSLTVNAQVNLWDMISGASLMVQFVLAILLIFSVISWAIIVYKYKLIKKMEKESGEFLEFFWHKRQFASISAAAATYRFTPFARIFAAGYNELLHERAQKKDAAQFSIGEMDIIQRALKKAISTEISRMEKAVSFLATTGNTTPFVGLFGTVWGIMNSFSGIAVKGSASLAVVAPGISEALIATAMGLLAAIPAVVAYNHFVTRINRMSIEMENFAGDFLNIVERELVREKK